MPDLERVNILGVGVSATNLDETVKIIDGWITRGDAHYVCIRDVHGIVRSQRDGELRHIHNAAGMVTPDGMPLVWLSRLKGHPQVERVCGSDLMLAVCEFSVERGYRHFFYGSSETVLERLRLNLKRRFPGLRSSAVMRPLSGRLPRKRIARLSRLSMEAAPISFG